MRIRRGRSYAGRMERPRKLNAHDRAALVLHNALLDLAKAARDEHAATNRRERLKVQAAETDILFRAERAFRAFQRAT